MHIYVTYYGRLSPSELNRVARDFNLPIFEWQILSHSKSTDSNTLETLMRNNAQDKDEFAFNRISKDFLLICKFADTDHVKLEYKEVNNQYKLVFSSIHDQNNNINFNMSLQELKKLKDVYEELIASQLFDNLSVSNYFEFIKFDLGGDNDETRE